jgi:hypothetical protein
MALLGSSSPINSRLFAVLNAREYSKTIKIKAEVRGVFCYWAARELGYGLTDLSRRLGMTQPGAGYAVKRGEQCVEENNYRFRET